MSGRGAPPGRSCRHRCQPGERRLSLGALCRAHSPLFAAQAHYPDQPVLALAIAARNAVGLTAQPVTPCGACRQVALEVEDRYQQPMRVLLYGTEGVYVVGSMHDLVPLSFSDGAMR